MRKVSQFSCKKRVFSSYGYGEEPENVNFKGSEPRRHLGVIYVCDSCFLFFQCSGLATQPALFYEVKRSWNTSDNGKSLVTPIQLVPAAAVCRRALIWGAAPRACPGPAQSWTCGACGRCGVCVCTSALQWGQRHPGMAGNAWAAHRCLYLYQPVPANQSDSG